MSGLLIFFFTQAQTVDFPYRLSYTQEVALFSSGGLLLASPFVIRPEKIKAVAVEMPLDPQGINLLDRVATSQWNHQHDAIRESMEYILPVLSVTTGGLWCFSDSEPRFKETVVLGTMYCEGLLLMAAPALAAKRLVDRNRPYMYNKAVSERNRNAADNNESMMSGNAALVFYHLSFACNVAHDMYRGKRWLPWLYGSAAALASVSALFSVTSGQHFPTDVAAGALLGCGVGWLMPYMHRKKAPAFQVYVSGMGASVYWTIQ